jgi:hypothetical protein
MDEGEYQQDDWMEAAAGPADSDFLRMDFKEADPAEINWSCGHDFYKTHHSFDETDSSRTEIGESFHVSRQSERIS